MIAALLRIQTLLWFLEHGLQVPVCASRGQVIWRRPRYTTIGRAS